MVPWQIQTRSTIFQAETTAKPVIHQCWAKLCIQEHKDLCGGGGQAARQGRAGQLLRTGGSEQLTGSGNPKFPVGWSSSTAELQKCHGAVFGSSHAPDLLPQLSQLYRDPKYPTRQNPIYTFLRVRRSLFGSILPRRVSPGPCTQRKERKQFLLTKFQAKFEDVIELCFCETFF